MKKVYYSAKVGSWGESEIIGMDIDIKTDGNIIEGTLYLDEDEELPSTPFGVDFSQSSIFTK